jgi:23S rRNA (pseudouridine1915-N3)-methyltransferase
MPFAITIVSLGRATDGFDDVYRHFIDLIKPYCPVTLEFIKPLAARSPGVPSLILHEGERLMERWPRNSWPVVLSPEGKMYDTMGFTRWIEGRRRAGHNLIFTIGGAYGLSAEIKKQSRETMSLSPLTLAHRVCAAVLLEQLYRAFTILNRHPYHK